MWLHAKVHGASTLQTDNSKIMECTYNLFHTKFHTQLHAFSRTQTINSNWKWPIETVPKLQLHVALTGLSAKWHWVGSFNKSLYCKWFRLLSWCIFLLFKTNISLHLNSILQSVEVSYFCFNIAYNTFICRGVWGFLYHILRPKFLLYSLLGTLMYSVLQC